MSADGFKVLPFPVERNPVVDAGRLGTRRHLIHGLLEFDVTVAREFLRRRKVETGEGLSFTAFILSCLAQAVQEQPLVQAYRRGSKQLVLFDEVDVVTLIEAEAGGVAIPHIIRGANRKTFRELHAEIRAVQADPKSSTQRGRLVRWGARAPGFVRNLFYRFMLRDPVRFKRYAGTVLVTAVGMFGEGAGWGFGFLPMHTLGITLGGIALLPRYVDGQVAPRECLSVTISLDHDVVDGTPAARFARRFKELVESGYGLESG